MDWTPGECYRESARLCDAEDIGACVAIMLDRGGNGDQFNTRVRVSGMTASEVVALLEIIKQTFIKSIIGT